MTLPVYRHPVFRAVLKTKERLNLTYVNVVGGIGLKGPDKLICGPVRKV